MKIPNYEGEREVMTCPACRRKIVARTVASLQPGQMTLDADGGVEIEVDAKLLYFNINHACPGLAAADGAKP